MITDPRFIVFNREAEFAHRLTCSGLTAVRKATPSVPGIYYDAFLSRTSLFQSSGSIPQLPLQEVGPAEHRATILPNQIVGFGSLSSPFGGPLAQPFPGGI